MVRNKDSLLVGDEYSFDATLSFERVILCVSVSARQFKCSLVPAEQDTGAGCFSFTGTSRKILCTVTLTQELYFPSHATDCRDTNEFCFED